MLSTYTIISLENRLFAIPYDGDVYRIDSQLNENSIRTAHLGMSG